MQAVGKAQESDENPKRLNNREERMRVNLCAFIDKSGYTPTQVADLSGVPQANLSRWMSGKSAIASNALPLLAEALGRESIDDFVSPTPPPQRHRSEITRDLPIIGKARPDFDPTEEDLADIRAAIDKIAARHEKKNKNKR